MFGDGARRLRRERGGFRECLRIQRINEPLA
jgi:hypothetical protein